MVRWDVMEVAMFMSIFILTLPASPKGEEQFDLTLTTHRCDMGCSPALQQTHEVPEAKRRAAQVSRSPNSERACSLPPKGTPLHCEASPQGIWRGDGGEVLTTHPTPYQRGRFREASFRALPHILSARTRPLCPIIVPYLPRANIPPLETFREGMLSKLVLSFSLYL
jgi:hypothetical protein